MLNKEKLVYRILSGYLRLKCPFGIFIIKGPKASQKYLAQELYEELYSKYEDELMSDNDLYDWLVSNNFWSYEEDEKLVDLKKNLEEFQVKLYELGFKGNEKKITKEAIAHTKKRIKELYEKRHAFDHLTASGMALIEKNKYLIGLGLCDEYEKPLFNQFNFLDHPFPFLDAIIISHGKQNISITEYRELARTEPWRQYWSAREGTAAVFSLPSIDLTDEQLNLISWTRLYDSIYQHPKCPDDNIIEDDDALDGFLIKDRRERQIEKDKDAVDGLITNERIKGADEVYVIADNIEDARRIDNINSASAKSIKRERDKYVDEHQVVQFGDLPDVKRRLQMEMNAAGIEAARNRRA